MAEIVWKLPVPSNSLLEDPMFHMSPGRVCTLKAEYEDDVEQIIGLSMIFEGVEAFRCTYPGAITTEFIHSAFGRVADFGVTEWLSAIQSQLRKSREDANGLRHLAIYFDEAPCYEFICRSFRSAEQVNRVIGGI